MIKTETLSDESRTLLFLYVTQVGIPSWARHEDGQVELIMKMFDWTEERTRKALGDNKAKGFAQGPVDPLDDDVIITS